jgi:hypothetical protein
MASREQLAQLKKRIFFISLLGILFCAFALPAQALADAPAPAAFPTLPEFIETVKDGSYSTLRGIYVQGVMAYAIDQQPSGSPGYVSGSPDKLTQFKMASSAGNLGLLAHNYLAGASFSQLKEGDTITIVFGNGRTQAFIVEDIQRYQALSPLSPYSNFTDLETQELLTAEQLFKKVYQGDFHLTLQTCIENQGDLSWGRLFIIAKPIDKTTFEDLKLNQG